MPTQSKSHVKESGRLVKYKTTTRVDVTFGAQYSRHGLDIQYGPLQMFSLNTTVQTLRIPPASFGEVGFYVRMDYSRVSDAPGFFPEKSSGVSWAIFDYECDSTGRFTIYRKGMYPEFKIGIHYEGRSGKNKRVGKDKDKDQDRSLPKLGNLIDVTWKLTEKGGETINEPFVQLEGTFVRSFGLGDDITFYFGPIKAVLRGTPLDSKAAVPRELLHHFFVFDSEGDWQVSRSSKQENAQLDDLLSWIEKLKSHEDLWGALTLEEKPLQVKVTGWASNTMTTVDNYNVSKRRAEAIRDIIKSKINSEYAKVTADPGGVLKDAPRGVKYRFFYLAEITIDHEEAVEKVKVYKARKKPQ